MAIIKRHAGFNIEYSEELDYFWRNGHDVYDGHVSVADCAASIDCFNRENRENDPSYPHDDTPSLGDMYELNY